MKKIIKKQKSLIILFVLIVFCLFSFLNKNDFQETENKNTRVLSEDSVTDIEKEQANKNDEKSELDENKLQEENQTELYKVIKVVDGDTIDIEINNVSERLRLIGINTPEIVDPRKAVECFGKEASNKAKEILNNSNVRIEADDKSGNRGKYGRLLRYVFLEDGTNFNKLMISEGYAYEYSYDVSYKYQDEFKQAEKEAREAKKGLWANGVCDEFNSSKDIIEIDNTKLETPENINQIIEEDISENEMGKLRITYIFYDGVEGKQEPDEYVSIKNIGKDSISMNGYTLEDESGKTYIFNNVSLNSSDTVKILTSIMLGLVLGTHFSICLTMKNSVIIKALAMLAGITGAKEHTG